MALPFDYNLHIKFCIFAWISFFLIWKNIVFLAILAIFRSKDKRVLIPEDATILGRQRQQRTSDNIQQTNNEEWSTANRITNVLGNETEYVTYFLIFFLAFTIVGNATTTRQLVYGCIFVIARCVHNSGLIFRNSYARIIGFFFSVLILGAITFDLAITLSIDVVNEDQLA